MAQTGRPIQASVFAFRKRGSKGSMLLRQRVLFQDRDDAEAQIFSDWLLVSASLDHDLTVSGISSGAPSVGAPALAVDHELIANGVSADAPTVGVPELTVDTVTASPSTPSQGGGGGSMSAGRVKAGSGRWVRVDSDPEDKPRPHSRVDHVMSARSISVGAPTAWSPSLCVCRAIAVFSVSAGSPIVGQPEPAIFDDSEVIAILELLEAA